MFEEQVALDKLLNYLLEVSNVNLKMKGIFFGEFT